MCKPRKPTPPAPRSPCAYRRYGLRRAGKRFLRVNSAARFVRPYVPRTVFLYNTAVLVAAAHVLFCFGRHAQRVLCAISPSLSSYMNTSFPFSLCGMPVLSFLHPGRGGRTRAWGLLLRRRLRGGMPICILAGLSQSLGCGLRPPLSAALVLAFSFLAPWATAATQQGSPASPAVAAPPPPPRSPPRLAGCLPPSTRMAAEFISAGKSGDRCTLVD